MKDTRSPAAATGGALRDARATLALGENVESPFRAMDEFDVFMDAVNRKISMDALIEFARDRLLAEADAVHRGPGGHQRRGRRARATSWSRG